MKEKLVTLYNKDGTKKILSSLISILIGLLVGGIAVILVGIFNERISPTGVWEGFRLIFAGILSTGRDSVGHLTWGFHSANVGNMLFRATPLILTGLSVAVAFKTGLFNIGAPGQYLMGTAATLFVALSIPDGAIPDGLVWILAFVAGCLAGAIWGAIPGIVKAFLNINEVLACIMTNWIAANLVTWFFDKSNLKNIVEGTKTGYVYKTTYGLVDGVYVDGAGVATPKLGLDKIFTGSQVNAGILIAIIIAILMYIIMNKTTLGYELKACGANRHSARYAGIKDKRNIILSMAIAGALAAAGASLYWLSGNTEFFWTTYQSLPAIGFNGIPVALLALNNPIAVIFTGIFMAMLDIVGLQLTQLTAYNEYITDVIIAVIVYLSAFSLVIRMWLSGRKKDKVGAVNANAEPAAKAATETATGEKPAVAENETEKGGDEV
ncbi:MAG: ABC transporter permease [Oscillospiraceae bacterium]|nr:ABC transporter permease [Oscillospiraceae bacterium]